MVSLYWFLMFPSAHEIIIIIIIVIVVVVIITIITIVEVMKTATIQHLFDLLNPPPPKHSFKLLIQDISLRSSEFETCLGYLLILAEVF